jgi:tRNA G10  N-methylase Trm11
MLKFHRRTIYEALGRDPVHPFPARMAPGIALQVMSEAEESIRVLDPMMGSGTVLAMARSQGHQAIGYDIDPLAVLISRVWTTATNVDEVREEAEDVLESARKTFKSLTHGDAYPRNCDEDTRGFIRYWFDEYSRRQLTALSLSISGVHCTTTRNVLWCGFSRLIIAKQAGASLALDLSHSRPHRSFTTAPAKPFGGFLNSIDRILENVISHREPYRGHAAAACMGDARALPLQSGSVDLVLTSPPYLNAIDYIRCSKFSLVWMGLGVNELREVRATSVGTEVGADAKQADPEIERLIDSLKIRDSMAPRHQRILARYIGDMRDAMTQVARVLSSSGKAVYVVGENTLRGSYIRTSRIVSVLAESVGLRREQRKTRELPANRRYLPPPSALNIKGMLNARMRREVVLTFAK